MAGLVHVQQYDNFLRLIASISHYMCLDCASVVLNALIVGRFCSSSTEIFLFSLPLSLAWFRVFPGFILVPLSLCSQRDGCFVGLGAGVLAARLQLIAPVGVFLP